MSAAAPIIADTIQHPPIQRQPTSPSPRAGQHSPFMTSPGIPALVSSDNANNQSPAMIEAQAQAQQQFRQRQLFAYQHQQQVRQQQRQQQYLLQQQQQQLQSYNSPDTQSQPPPLTPKPVVQQPASPLLTKYSSGELTPINTTDLLLTDTPALSPPLLLNTTPVSKPASNMHSKTQSKNNSTGLAVLRLLQFAEQLSPGDQAQHRGFWDGFVTDFFTRTSQTKLGLRNNDTDEQKTYYISHYSTATFFHALYECGVTSIQLTLEQTMEYVLPGGQMNVECPRASFLYHYGNGSLVTSTGHLWVRFSLSSNGVWKIKHFEFACQGNEEYISRSNLLATKDGLKPKKSTKCTLPESSVNAWGLPSRTFHIVQMLDAASRLNDLVFYSLISGSNAKDSLNAVAWNMEQRKDARDNSTKPSHSTSDATKMETDTMVSSPVITKKKTPKSTPAARRKSLKTEKAKVDGNQQDINDPVTIATANVSGGGLESPVVKTQGSPSMFQQQPYLLQQQQRKALLQQQVQSHQQQLHQQQQEQHLHQQQQILLHMQQQQQNHQALMSGTNAAEVNTSNEPSLSPAGLPQQGLQQLPDPLTSDISYPASLSQLAYPGPFALTQTQQQFDEMDEFIKSPQQSRKRNHSISESKKSPISRKKGTSAATPTPK